MMRMTRLCESLWAARIHEANDPGARVLPVLAMAQTIDLGSFTGEGITVWVECGDGANLALWLAMMLTAMVGFTMLRRKIRG